MTKITNYPVHKPQVSPYSADKIDNTTNKGETTMKNKKNIKKNINTKNEIKTETIMSINKNSEKELENIEAEIRRLQSIS